MPDQFDHAHNVLADSYVIERELGRGSMGVVFLAEDVVRSRKVAVKFLHADVAAAVESERFAREVKIAARLQHPHILQVLDSGEAAGIPYYVTPFIEGPSLKQLLEEQEQLSLEHSVKIASQVANALAHAHELGVVHRDITPANILLSHDHAIVADFGIAKTPDELGEEPLTTQGLIVGTPTYMSPEQITGKDALDGRSDVYSLGCVLYEMLVGEPPFAGKNMLAVLARQSTDPTPSVRLTRPSVPNLLEDVVTKATEKVPADRYQTAMEMADALQDIDLLTTVARGAQPAKSAGTRWAYAFVLFVLALGAAGIVRTVMFPQVELDPNRILVFPLGASESLGDLGEDVATMIGHALDGTAPLRWIDGWSLLEPEERENEGGVSPSRLIELARERRAAFTVRGRVVSLGDSIQVILELRDVRGDSTVAQGSKTAGETREAWRAGLLAVNELLPALISGARQELAQTWIEREPADVANFLMGERAFHRTQFEEALQNYETAVASDSTFALAAIRGAQAASWGHEWNRAARLIAIPLQQAEGVPARQLLFARGVSAYLRGDADSAIVAIRGALELDPDMSVAWLQLGEIYSHLIPSVGKPDSIAADAFEQVQRLNPGAVNVLFHLFEHAIRRGDTERAAAMRERFRASEPDPRLDREMETMYRCVADGPDAVDWRDETDANPFEVLAVARSLAVAGSQMACAEAGFRSVLNFDTAGGARAASRRFSAVVGLQNAYLARNATADAVSLVDSIIAAGEGGTSIFLMDAALGVPLDGRISAIVEAERERFGENYSAELRFPVRLWRHGLLESANDDHERVIMIAARLRDIATETGSNFDRMLARGMTARVALALGDTAQAIAQLRALAPSLPSNRITWGMAETLGPERLLLAELLHEAGEYEEAIAVASVFDSPAALIYTLYLPASLELRRSAAAALGDQASADRYAERLVNLRD